MIAILVVAVSAAACSTATINRKAKVNLLQRAGFDLDCDKVVLSVLAKSPQGLVTQYGVRGCGRKAAYLLEFLSQTWTLNAGYPSCGVERGGPSTVPGAGEASLPGDVPDAEESVRSRRAMDL